MKKIPIIIVVVALMIVGFIIYKKTSFDSVDKGMLVASSYKNATYSIEGQNVKLVDGISSVESAPGSSSKIITKYFGNEVKHDFDSDGREDTAFILTQETGGSGVFYYLVVALNKVDGYVGSHAIFLGDRIAPQTTEIGKGNIIVVNYADRNPGESFAVAPSVGKSIWLLLDTNTLQFGEVAQNFEGEADPSKMTLGMKPWTWISTTYSDGKEIKPVGTKKFILTLKSDKTFSATTDCNGVGGEYVVNQNLISFSKMVSTQMYCEGAKEGDFTKMLSQVDSYFFTSKGELVFDLKFDTGSSIFK